MKLSAFIIAFAAAVAMGSGCVSAKDYRGYVPTGVDVKGTASYVMDGDKVVQHPDYVSDNISCAQGNDEKGKACWDAVFEPKGDGHSDQDDE